MAAEDNSVSVAEDSRNGLAGGALEVHEEGVGSLHKALLLVLSLGNLRRRVEKVVLNDRHLC